MDSGSTSAGSFIRPVINLPEPQGSRQPSILPPIAVRSSGRPRKDRTDNSTCRDPSLWEIAEEPEILEEPELNEFAPIDSILASLDFTMTAAATAATIAATAATMVAIQGKRRRGRPPSSNNKPKPVTESSLTTTTSQRFSKQTLKSHPHQDPSAF
jgi:hypothetical protein